MFTLKTFSLFRYVLMFDYSFGFIYEFWPWMISWSTLFVDHYFGRWLDWLLPFNFRKTIWVSFLILFIILPALFVIYIYITGMLPWGHFTFSTTLVNEGDDVISVDVIQSFSYFTICLSTSTLNLEYSEKCFWEYKRCLRLGWIYWSHVPMVVLTCTSLAFIPSSWRTKTYWTSSREKGF